MKKLFVIVLIFVVVAGVFGQAEFAKDMSYWADFEKELKDIMIKGINDLRAKSNPTSPYNSWSKNGIKVAIYFRPERQTYELILFTKPDGLAYEDLYLATTITTGATKTWERLYGKSRSYYETGIGDYAIKWICTTWYQEAMHVKYGIDKEREVIILVTRNNYKF